MSKAEIQAITPHRDRVISKAAVLGKQRQQVLLFQGATIAVLVAGWEIAGLVNPALNMFFPSIDKILAKSAQMLISGQLNIHLATTGYEVLWGFSLGAGLGISLGIILGSTRIASGIFEPFVLYTASIPKIIFYPLFILVLGVGVNSKIGIGAVSAFFPIAINTMAGVKEVSPAFIKAARTLGASTWSLYTKVYLPVITGPIIAGVRVGLGMAIIGTLLAETKVSRAGLGSTAIEQYNNLRMADMYSIIIIIFAATMALNWALALAYSRATKYRGKQQR